MVDVTTNQPIRVLNEGTVGPFIEIPLTQLNEIKQFLERHKVYFWPSPQAGSYNGGPYIVTINNDGPYIVTINFGRVGDQHALQQLFDSVK